MISLETVFSGITERDRLAVVDEAESLARSLGDDDLLCYVLVWTAFTFFAPSRWDAWLRASAGSHTARRPGSVIRCGRWPSGFGWALASLVTGACTSRTRSLTRCSSWLAYVHPALSWIAEYQSLRSLVLRGGGAAFGEMNDRLLERGQELGQPDAFQWWSASLVFDSVLRGELEPLVDAGGDFADQFPADMTWRMAYVFMLADVGRLDEARAQARHYFSDVAVLTEIAWPLLAIGMVARVAIELDDVQFAVNMAAALAPFPDAWIHDFLCIAGPACWSRGVALSAAGEHDAAVAELERGLDKLLEHGLGAHATRLRFDLARVLRRRGGPGDAARAADLLAQVRTEATVAGYAGLVAKVDALR